jgi:hypothetical protein
MLQEKLEGTENEAQLQSTCLACVLFPAYEKRKPNANSTFLNFGSFLLNIRILSSVKKILVEKWF